MYGKNLQISVTGCGGCDLTYGLYFGISLSQKPQNEFWDTKKLAGTSHLKYMLLLLGLQSQKHTTILGRIFVSADSVND